MTPTGTTATAERPIVYQIDALLTHRINEFAGGGGLPDLAMIWLSAAGIPALVLAVACQWWLGRNRQDTRHVVVAAGLSFLLGLALNQLILLFVDRTRPFAAGVSDLLIAPSVDPSFPSDHATAAFAIAAAFLVHGLRRRGLVFLIAALLVSVSRIYVGTHYASDVLGGAATGVLAAAVVPSLYGKGTRLDKFIIGIL